MEDKKPFNEQESLALITEMIQKAKSNFHESGTSAILWGVLIGICGLVSYAQLEWDFSIGFNIWYLAMVAVLPQVWISVRESRRKVVRSHRAFATDMVWIVYAVSIVSLILYNNVVPSVSEKMFADDNLQLLSRNTLTGEISEWHIILPSLTSVYLIIYAFPTLATGLICDIRPMVWGAMACYAFFLVSLFTPYKYDMLLSGLAAIGNWLIPGLILRKSYLKGKAN